MHASNHLKMLPLSISPSPSKPLGFYQQQGRWAEVLCQGCIIFSPNNFLNGIKIWLNTMKDNQVTVLCPECVQLLVSSTYLYM